MLLNGLKIEDFKLIKIAFKYWELLQNKQAQYLGPHGHKVARSSG